MRQTRVTAQFRKNDTTSPVSGEKTYKLRRPVNVSMAQLLIGFPHDSKGATPLDEMDYHIPANKNNGPY